MMRRSLALVALIVLAVPSVRAEDPESELRFIQALRTSGHPDLALEYMDKRLKPKSAAALKDALPLERARCRLTRAEGETDLGKRLADYKRAQDEFEAYLKTKPPDARAAEANLELARVAAAQARIQYRKALADEDDDSRKKEMTRSRELFQIADARLKDAVKQIDAQLDKLGDAKADEDKLRKRSLLAAKHLADFEQGTYALERALTIGGEDLVQRGQTIEKEAVTQLDKVANDNENPYAWEARAWMVRCYGEVDKVKPAKKEYTKVMNEARGPDADKAKRLALYYYIRLINSDQDVKDKPGEVIKFADDWLRRYKKYANTPEGNGVRLRLAKAHLEKAQGFKNQRDLAAQQEYKIARDLFKALELGGSEYANEARQNKIRIVLILAENKGDVSQLNNFEECYLEAQLEMYRMAEEQKKLAAERKALPGKADAEVQKFKADEKKFETAQKAHYKKIVTAIQRALSLPPNPEVSPKEVLDARAILAYCYLEQGDLYRAALLAEDLARSEPESETAPAAAAYALQAYLRIATRDEETVGRLEQLPDGDDEKKLLPLRRLELQADRGRVAKLARYMEQKWPDDPATDFARHQLAITLLREEDFPAAMDVLGRITSAYNNFAYTRYQLALAADELIKKGTRKDGSKLTAADKKAIESRAVEALKSIPDLSDLPDGYSAMVYVLGRAQLGRIYFRNQQYDEVEKLADQLDRVLGNPKLARMQDELRPQVESLLMSAKYARFRTAYDASNFTKVAELAAPEVKRLEDMVDKTTGKLPELRDRELQRGILGIVIRAYIEQGKTAEANKVLGLLQKTAGEGESITSILLPVAQQFQGRITDLEKKGASAGPQLKRTKESFGKFLDELAKQPAKTLTPEILLFLSQCYSGLEDHVKAVETLQKLPAPEDDPKAPPGKDQDPEYVKQLQDRRAKQAVPRAGYVLLGRELRLAKKLPEAQKVLDTIRKTGWGKQRLEVMVEWNYLLMDEEKFGGAAGAIQQWNALLKALQPRVLDDKTKEDFKEPYYNCYFQLVKSFVLAGKKAPWEKRPLYMKKAAEFTAALQKSSEPWGTELTKKHFEELLAQEPDYKAEFDKVKAPEKK